MKPNLKGKLILDETNETYGLRTRVYACGNIVQLYFYTVTWKVELATGGQSVLLGTIPEQYRPKGESRAQMLITSTGQRFNVRVDTSGRIMIYYVYSAITVNTQVVQNFTYIVD